MQSSTMTSKGQTTVPKQVREALNLKPHQKMIWEIKADGTVEVHPQPSLIDFIGCLKSDIPFPGLKEEREAVRQSREEESYRKEQAFLKKNLHEHSANEGRD